jgi:hypothetical protein
LRKLPTHAPSTNRKTMASAGGIGGKREGMCREDAGVGLLRGFNFLGHCLDPQLKRKT